MTISARGRTLLLVALASALLLAAARVQGRLADEPAHCQNCMDGMPMNGCPSPSMCGYAPILCVDCMDGMAMPLCPVPSYCTGIDCSKMQCIDGQPTATCPDPGVCGKKPIACTGCVPGVFRWQCPRSEWCTGGANMTTPPCMDCMAGMAMPYCANATQCLGAGPLPAVDPPCAPAQCTGCMAGMPMPGCPDPDACGMGSSCTMQMVFGASSKTCIFLARWGVSDTASWFAALFGILLLAFLREGLQVYRVHRAFAKKQHDNLARMYHRDPTVAARLGHAQDQHQPGQAITISSGGSREGQKGHLELGPTGGSPGEYHALSAAPASYSSPSVFTAHLLESTYYFLSLVLGYLLMLLIMTYNVGVCLMVVGGCFLAHFLCTYIYDTRLRPKCIAMARRQVEEFASLSRSMGHAAAGASGSAAANSAMGAGAPSSSRTAPGAGVVVEGAAPVTGGDHCCDDINFDDI